MKLIRFIALGLLVVLAAPARASEVEVYYWHLTPEGEGSVGIDGLEGTKVDLEDDLGYGDPEASFGANVVLGSMHQLAISYLSLELSADNEIDREVRFGDEVFRATSDVSSELDATLLRAAYQLQVGSDTVRGGFLIGAQYVDLSASASATGIGEESEDADAGLLVVGGFLRLQPIPALVLRASLVGGTWDMDDVSADILDGEVSASFVLDPFFMGIGYRHIAIDGEDNSVPLDFDLTFSGPTAYAGLTF
jgi:hypothetical protein